MVTASNGMCMQYVTSWHDIIDIIDNILYLFYKEVIQSVYRGDIMAISRRNQFWIFLYHDKIITRKKHDTA